MAVRVGFEPTVGFNTYNALAKRRFRPLSHLTGECWRHKAEDESSVKGKLKNDRAFHTALAMAANRAMKQRLTAIGLSLALLFGTTGCTVLAHVFKGRKKKDDTRVERATVPERVGEIVLLNDDARFVLVDLDTGNAPDAGTALKVMRQGVEVGVLALGDVRRRPFIVADIVSGTPQKGDLVYR